MSKLSEDLSRAINEVVLEGSRHAEELPLAEYLGDRLGEYQRSLKPTLVPGSEVHPPGVRKEPDAPGWWLRQGSGLQWFMVHGIPAPDGTMEYWIRDDDTRIFSLVKAYSWPRFCQWYGPIVARWEEE